MRRLIEVPHEADPALAVEVNHDTTLDARERRKLSSGGRGRGNTMEDEGLSEYEKQRIARISENRARMEALGLPLLASSLLGSSSKQQPQKKSKRKRRGVAGDEGDEDYQPFNDDGGETEEDQELESSFEAEEDDARTSSGSRRKGKKWSSLITAKFMKTSNARKSLNESDIFDDEAALKKAIALSLGAKTGSSAKVSVEVSQSYANVAGAYAQGKKDDAKTQKSTGRKKARKSNKARVQLAEDEVVAFFFSFDETGKGYITPRDVKKMVTSHDFSWTDTEIAHMIHSFDSGGDGKLSLEDFRSIVIRCKMLQGTGE